MGSFLSWFWWSSLNKPWLYAVVAIVALYVLFGAIVIWVLSHIGIAGAQQGSSPVDSANQMVLLLLVAGIVVGVVILWGLKLSFSK